MKKIITLLGLSTLPILASLGLTACGETVHDIPWYVEHTNERNAMIEKCQANIGELGDTPNCINADRGAVEYYKLPENEEESNRIWSTCVGGTDSHLCTLIRRAGRESKPVIRALRPKPIKFN